MSKMNNILKAQISRRKVVKYTMGGAATLLAFGMGTKNARAGEWGWSVSGHYYSNDDYSVAPYFYKKF